jgi:hypothetical protein
MAVDQADQEGPTMRYLETAAMFAMIVGAQTLAIGTILIH